MSAARPRRDLGRSDYARRGLVLLVAAGLVLTAVWLQGSGAIGGPRQVSAHLADVGGSLGPGADVKVRGVIVGSVAEVDAAPDGGVDVRIDVREGRLEQVPDNVVARILPATVFGTSYVDLVHHGSPSDVPLRAGAVIPADTTQRTLELQQALDDIDALVKAVGPADLASAIGSVAQALDGRGARLGTTLDRAAGYLGRLEPELPLVRRDLRALARSLEVVADVAPDLLAATGDALVTARTITEKAPAIEKVLADATALTVRADEFLRATRAQLTRFLANSSLLLGVVHDNRRAGISGAIDTNRMLAAKVASVVEHGFINAATTFLFDVPAYYGPRDCPRVGRVAGDNCGGGR